MLIAGGAITLAIVWFVTRPAPVPVTRLLLTPSTAAAALTLNGLYRDLAITPDGTRVVYIATNGSQLLVRALERRLSGAATDMTVAQLETDLAALSENVEQLANGQDFLSRLVAQRHQPPRVQPPAPRVVTPT